MTPMLPSSHLSALWKKGTDFLGTPYAVMGGAMSWVSERNLVAAVSDAGAFGVIACSSMTPDLLEEEIAAAKALTSKPFGVNLIVMHPKLDELADVCLRQNVSHIVLAGGLPSKALIDKIQRAGSKAIAFAPALPAAKRLARFGIDALVIEGSEAGGHIGPTSTSVLCQEILPHMAHALPIFVAGGIGRGEAVAAYLRMGAAGVQIGTRLVCATESIAHPAFKRAFVNAHARDAAVTVQLDPDFPVIPVRALKNKATDLFMQAQKDAISDYKSGKLSKNEAALQIEHFWAGALRRAVIDGDVENGSLMAGQSVGMVEKEEPTRDILARLVRETEDALRAGPMS
ncbi:MAG: nitronate monooxygenase [Rickettsiales bacterium]